jgi:hypothetical protein
VSILTQSPSWFIPLCIAAGLAYAGALYFRDRFNRTYGTRLATGLGILRFLAATLLAFLLLKPVIRTIDRIVEKPVIVIAQDNTASLVVGPDSAYYRGAYLEQLSQLTQAFGDDYEVRTLRFGSKVDEGIDSLRFDEKLTDLGALMDDIYSRFSGRNLGAVIIASDGLYNKGQNPIYQSRKLNVPFFTVALGDTTVYRDLLVSDVAVNRLAYLGNRFPVNIIAEARKAAGLTSTVTVSRNGAVLYTEDITFNGESDVRTLSLSLEALETGLQRYTVSMTSVDGEVTLANNRRDFFIDVLDARQKVLILAHSPHPDVAALREALITNESYQVTAELADRFSGRPDDYSLVIFHQLPATGGRGGDLVRSFIDRNIPALFIWGTQTDFREFNALEAGFALDNFRMSTTDVGGAVDESFPLFTLGDQARDMFRFLPPLAVPFGDIRTGAGSTTFITQQVGRISTQRPLIAFNRYGDSRVGLICGEGIWRWRLGAFQQYESHDAFTEWATKVVQYLAAKDDKSLFRVSGAQNIQENMPVIFQAEVYNESYEPQADKDVRMSIRNEEDEEFDYTFSSSGVRYTLNTGKLPPGNYRYRATVAGTSLPAETGEFSVIPLQLESAATIADHRLLRKLAEENGGALVQPDAMQELPGMIARISAVAPVSYENKELTDLINFRWLLAIILLLLSAEWLLRKRAGTY